MGVGHIPCYLCQHTGSEIARNERPPNPPSRTSSRVQGFQFKKQIPSRREPTIGTQLPPLMTSDQNVCDNPTAPRNQTNHEIATYGIMA